MLEPRQEAIDLLCDYFSHSGLEWPGHTAEKIQHRIATQNGRWLTRHHVADVDKILDESNFDVDDLSTNYLGATIRLEDLRYLDGYLESPVFGYAKPAEWSIAICHRALTYKPLYRATVMHELGHLMLHSFEPKRAVAFTPFATQFPPEEVQANRFMVESLLPKSVLLLAIARFAETADLDLRFVLEKANLWAGRTLWRDCIFVPTVAALGVSRRMICLRLKQMKVFNDETCAFHKSYSANNEAANPDTSHPLSSLIQQFRDTWWI